MASTVLAAGGIPESSLRRVMPRVEPASIPVRPAPGWLQAMWLGPVHAMSLPRTIYVRPDLVTDPTSLARLVLHELVHVEQWSRYGIIGFVTRYLGGYLAGRVHGLGHSQAYREIPLEEEARRTARNL